MKNTTIITAFLFGITTLTAQNKQLFKTWETPAELKVPESVLYSKQNNLLYFSNIDGDYKTKDGKGSIGKIATDGKNLVIDWITGLNAPKGLGLYKNNLYVADIDEVVVIDLKTQKILQHIHVDGATFLNDITIDGKGKVYVSDSGTGKIHCIENGKLSLFMEERTGVNGLLAVGDNLYTLEKGVLWKVDKTKKAVKIAEGMEESTDGIEQTSTGDFIVSCWSGVIYYVKADGSKYELIDTRSEKSNTADIGFDAATNTVYVPTFFGNKIVAYQLK